MKFMDEFSRLLNKKHLLSIRMYFLTHFAAEPSVTPVQIHILSTPRDVISFNGQGQICPLTCAEWRDLSNHTSKIDQ